MTPPTPEELLRLARKAWPEHHVRVTVDVVNVYVETGAAHGVIMLLLKCPKDRARGALLVLAGELDVAALLAERDRPQRDVLDFARLCVRLRNTEGSDEAPTQQAALEWLSTLEDP